MCPGACQMKTSIQTQYRGNMRNYANLKPMKCTPTLICLQVSGKAIEAWMSGIMQCKLKSIWLNTPQETAKILHCDFFWFFLHDEEFVSKTINDSNVDLEKFPASKVRQLAKKMESSKASAHHIKQVAGDPQAAQINLIRHQHTEIPLEKNKKTKSYVKPKQLSHKHAVQKNPQESSYNKKSFGSRNMHKKKDRCSKFGVSTHVEGFQCPAKKFQCKACHKFGHFTSFWYQKKHPSNQED